MTITFALAIPHTPWNPERVASFTRLQNLLVHRPPHFREFTDREPNWSWSGKLWKWGLDTGATHLVQLQDDVLVCPRFWPLLRAMVEARRDDVIGLESVLDIGSPWYTTGDGIIGVGYVLPREAIREMLAWRESKLRPGSIQSLNEDQLLGLWCFVTGRKVWHPTPTIIDHDVDMASTYGNDGHTHRRPVRSTVRGDAPPETWAVEGTAPHVKRFYAATPAVARHHVKGYSFERYKADMR